MNSEMINRAHALLALRDKATPGPWKYGWTGMSILLFPGNGGPTIAGLPYDGNEDAELAKLNADFIVASHDMADLIRDQDAKIAALLAENGRLKAINSDFVSRWNDMVVASAKDADRVAAAETELKAQVQCTLQVLKQRQKAEAQYRKLCEAEPVAFGHSFLHGSIPLIPRPSMESNNE